MRVMREWPDFPFPFSPDNVSLALHSVKLRPFTHVGERQTQKKGGHRRRRRRRRRRSRQLLDSLGKTPSGRKDRAKEKGEEEEEPTGEREEAGEEQKMYFLARTNRERLDGWRPGVLWPSRGGGRARERGACLLACGETHKSPGMFLAGYFIGASDRWPAPSARERGEGDTRSLARWLAGCAQRRRKY